MTAPRVDHQITWGSEWRPASRRAVAPTVTAAVDLAVSGFPSLDIPLEVPKTFFIRRAVRTFPNAGTSLRPGLIELYLNTDAVKRRKVPQMLGLLSIVSFHEMVHNERQAITDRDDLLEHVATEGLAHCADTLYAGLLLEDWEYHNTFDAIRLVSPKVANALTAELVSDSQLESEMAQLGDAALFDHWMEQESPEFGFYPAGVVVGAYHVDQRIKQGFNIAEMLHWTPEEILGL